MIPTLADVKRIKRDLVRKQGLGKRFEEGSVLIVVSFISRPVVVIDVVLKKTLLLEWQEKFIQGVPDCHGVYFTRDEEGLVPLGSGIKTIGEQLIDGQLVYGSYLLAPCRGNLQWLRTAVQWPVTSTCHRCYTFQMNMIPVYSNFETFFVCIRCKDLKEYKCTYCHRDGAVLKFDDDQRLFRAVCALNSCLPRIKVNCMKCKVELPPGMKCGCQ